MPVQRDVTSADDLKDNLILSIVVGNAGLGDTTVTINGNLLKDNAGNTLHFTDSFTHNLGVASGLLNTDIEVFTTVAKNPAINNQTLSITYDILNTTFLTGKSRTLTSSDYTGGSDNFSITIRVI
jgi:hypothetical protein